MTKREEELLQALKDSHKLLRHYATLLNMHDGGHRIIPVTVHAWIKRLRIVRENNEEQDGNKNK